MINLIPTPHRYIYYFSGLLSGAIKINSASLLLHQVHIPAITNYEPGEGTHTFDHLSRNHEEQFEMFSTLFCLNLSFVLNHFIKLIMMLLYGCFEHGFLS